MIDKKLKDIFSKICQMNDQLITCQDSLCPMFFLINKKHELKIIACPFKRDDEKEQAKNVIMKMIANEELAGYIAILDCNMTKWDHKTNKGEGVQEVCLRTLYTANEVVRDWVIHEGTKVIGPFDTSFIEKAGNKASDQWNYWTRSETVEPNEAKINKDYYEYKRKHPGFYK